MKCPKCGNEIASGIRFCGACGTAVPDQVETADFTPMNTTPKKPFPVKGIAFGGVALVVVIVAALLCIKLFAPPKYLAASGSYFVYQDSPNSVTVRFDDGTEQTMNGKLQKHHTATMESGKGYLVVRSMVDDGYLDTIYYVSDKKAKPFADEANGNGILGAISADGSAVAFFTEGERSGNYSEGRLSIYNGEKTQYIAPAVFSSYISSYCISPDGKTVAYLTYDEEEDDLIARQWINGKSTVLGKGLITFALSNGGKLMYYIDGSKMNAYVLKGKERTKLDSAEELDEVWLNADNTSLIFSSDSGKSYIFNNGGMKTSLSGEISGFLLPPGALCVEIEDGVTIVGVKDFKNTYYCSYDAIYRITNKYETERIVRSYTTAELANDEKTLFYLSSGSVYKIDGTKSNAEPTMLVDGDVKRFDAIGNGSAVYYVNFDDELFYQKGKGKPTFIGDVQNSNGFATYDRDGTVFFLNDGELYSAKGGGKASLVTGVDSDDLESIHIVGNDIVVYEDDRNTQYRSNDGKSFAEIYAY